MTLIRVINRALSTYLYLTAWGELRRADEQHLCATNSQAGRGAVGYRNPTPGPYLSTTHLPRLAFQSKLKGVHPSVRFLSLAAEPGLSHHKQLPFLIYTSGVGSWTHFIRAHDHQSLQD